MRARPTVAAGAATAVAALALAGVHSPAQAAYHHAEGGRTAAASTTGFDPAVTPDFTVTSTKKVLTLSASTIAPGNHVVAFSGKGSMDVISLGSNYTIADFGKDAGKAFKGDVKAVRKIDKKVTFWGGADGPTSEVGLSLPAGSYWVVNPTKELVAPLTVTGVASTVALPATTGTIKMVGDMTFHADATLPNHGWITIKNKASEPHFVVFQKVQKGTTKDQVRDFLMGGAQGQPSWAKKQSYSTEVVSPGHSYTYYVDAKKGDYVELCFYPSKKTGVPHAFMGMFDISSLK